MLTIEKPGLLTTVQDLGRYGYQKYGVITSGAMDPLAHRIANILVGNKEMQQHWRLLYQALLSHLTKTHLFPFAVEIYLLLSMERRYNCGEQLLWKKAVY